MNPKQVEILRHINRRKALLQATRRSFVAQQKPQLRSNLPGIQLNNRRLFLLRRQNMLRSQQNRIRQISISRNNIRIQNMNRIQRLNNMNNRIQRPRQNPITPTLINRVQTVNRVPVRTRINSNRVNQVHHQPSPVISIPQKVGQKYAILVGINYKNTNYQLNGCINDIQDMKDVLMKQYGFSVNCILTLTDESIIRPTRDNIIKSFKRIQDIARIRNHIIQELWFVYSGHGTWSVDLNGDEVDRRDERIVSMDIKTISDDELNGLFKTFSQDMKVVSIFDSCYSGTVMDCRLSYNFDTKHFDTTNSQLVGFSKWVSLSACKDNEESEEGVVQEGGGGVGRYNGYFIRSLIDTLKENNYKINYNQLMSKIQEKILAKGGKQRAQLSANVEISLDSSF
jgi:hypothetical protein